MTFSVRVSCREILNCLNKFRYLCFMGFILQIIASAIAVILASYLLPGVQVDSFFTAIVVAVVLAFLNAVVKPVMILFTIPITLFSFGLFLFVINAFIILFADRLIDGFEVKSFWWALIFSFVLWFVTSVIENVKNFYKPKPE